MAQLRLLVICAAFVLFALPACSDIGHEKYYPAEADAFMGNWYGRWNEEEDVDPDVAAQVIPLGGDEYRIIIKAKLDMRSPPKVDVTAKASRGRLRFDDHGYFGEIDGDRFTGGRGSKARFAMRRVDMASPTLGVPAPEGADVLFDGTDLSAWQGGEWYVLDGGVMMVKPGTGDVHSKKSYRDVRMHVEFRTPLMPRAHGQQRGNSGVFLQDTYEVQVLDSFGLEGYYDECGALYKVSAPKVNACRPPLQWQTYDITYHAPRYDDAGELVQDPHMTVYHNGVLIQKDQPMPWITGWKEEDRLAPPPKDPGPIKLQDHGNYVQYRNIWVLPLQPES